MVKLERFDMVLTKPQSVYTSGDTVEGELIIYLNRGMKIKGVNVKCHGLSHVFWTEENKNAPTETITYSGSEEYIDETLVIMQAGTDEESMEIPEGRHVYPFKFLLPDNLPASFEGKHKCYIRYCITGTMEKPWKKDKEITEIFTVASTLDLNNEGKAKQKFRKEKIQTIGGWCCETGPAFAKLKLQRSGFVPGENIICDAEINEGTGRGAHWSKFRLMMKTFYQTPKTKDTKVSKHSDVTQIAMIQHGPISPGYDDEYDNEHILVPPLPPSHLQGCSLINISYYVELLVNLKHPTINVSIKHDIFIGTIPLQSLVKDLTKPPKPAKWKKKFSIDIPPPKDKESLDSLIKPPCYRSSVLGTGDLDEEFDQSADRKKFTPKYIYYDWIEKRQAQLEEEARKNS